MPPTRLKLVEPTRSILSSFMTGSGNFISQTAPSFASAGNSWTLFSTTVTAPVNAAQMAINFIQAVGAGASSDWVTLIDDVSITYPTTGPTNVLAATVQAGAVFTATILTNGVTATAATGNVEFLTNSVAAEHRGGRERHRQQHAGRRARRPTQSPPSTPATAPISAAQTPWWWAAATSGPAKAP